MSILYIKHFGRDRFIEATFIYPPIPDRRFDWQAVDANAYDGPGSSPIGYGPTRHEAIANLLEQFEMEDEK